MTRPRTRAGLAAGLIFGLMAVGCGESIDTSLDQLNLDRPVDVAFACYGGLRLSGGAAGSVDDEIIRSAMPTSACAIRSRPVPVAAEDLPNVPVGQENLIDEGGAVIPGVVYQALILQSVPGTVAFATMPTKPGLSFSPGDITVDDSNSLIPGKNGISVGSLPIALAVDRDGCFAVTANAGSCDLSVLDITSAVREVPDPIVNRITVINATGQEVRARPAAMLAEPASGVIGQTCAAEPTGVVFVAYPSCHLVAAIEPATGEIVAGIQFAEDGTPSITDGNVTCPAECGGGEAATPGPRPVALSLMVDPRTDSRRLVIGSENSPSLSLVELSATAEFNSVSQLALEGDIGVLKLALSPQIGMGGSSGSINDDTAAGGQFQFVYAVATDGTVRVADILSLREECDTQVDPRYLRGNTDVGFLSCMPVGDPATPPRRAGAIGPGIQLPGEGVAQSVAIVAVDTYDGDTRLTVPSKLIGYFAVIGATSGAVFIANIDDDDYADFLSPGVSVAVSVPLAIAHQLRDSVRERGLVAETTNDNGDSVLICDTDGPNPDDSQTNAGGPRAAIKPTRLINLNYLSPEKASSIASIRQVQCDGDDGTFAVSELSFAAPVETRDEVFPDLSALQFDEDWSLIWEGLLSLDGANSSIDGPSIRAGTVTVGGLGMRVLDASKPYCAAGVEPGDEVGLRGCNAANGNAGCPLGFECYSHPDSEVATGSCLPADQIPLLSSACRDFLISSKRYSVAEVNAGEIKLKERHVVLENSPTSGCTSAVQCSELDAYSQRLAYSADPVDDTTVIEPHSWACEQDTSRPATADRCVLTCDTDEDCGAGHSCNEQNRCIEGVVPPLQCVVGLQRYELRASDAFVMIGSRSGYRNPWTANETTGACEIDPATDSVLSGRIPLVAPPCLGSEPSELDPNPCSLAVDQWEVSKTFDSSCVATEGDPVSRATTGIRLRTPGINLTMVDLTYPGDLVCNGDRGGSLVDVPVVFPGLSYNFRQVNGRAPLTLDFGNTDAILPTQIVAGPQGSIWVVDEGDYLSTTNTLPSTRGKVFRVEGQALTAVSVLQ